MLVNIILGRLFAMFANIIFSFQFDLKQSNKMIETEEDKILNTILKTFFDGFLTKNLFQKNNPNCNFAARNLLPNYLVSISLNILRTAFATGCEFTKRPKADLYDFRNL